MVALALSYLNRFVLGHIDPHPHALHGAGLGAGIPPCHRPRHRINLLLLGWLGIRGYIGHRSQHYRDFPSAVNTIFRQ